MNEYKDETSRSMLINFKEKVTAKKFSRSKFHYKFEANNLV